MASQVPVFVPLLKQEFENLLTAQPGWEAASGLCWPLSCAACILVLITLMVIVYLSVSSNRFELQQPETTPALVTTVPSVLGECLALSRCSVILLVKWMDE